ncbi:hypothetical protein SEA_LIBERTYBELL_40 [Streptomyces phage LibertyBell]|nr:hypothetical protein SEA_LIBERTYBELL_40 [Streptomyces phage LibertyBell]
MSETNANAEKTSILTTAMLNAKNKLTRETVPNEDANKPKKTLRSGVAFGLGALAGAAAFVAMIKVTAAAAAAGMEDSSDEDVTLDD